MPAQARRRADRARRRARVTLEHAAAALDLGAAAWRYFAAARGRRVQPGRRCAGSPLETRQPAFGAIGHAEEHEAPRHFRRAHLDALAVRRHRGGSAATLAARLLDDPGERCRSTTSARPAMRFRAEVRDWLQQHWSGERKAAFDREALPRARVRLPPSRATSAPTGWLGLGWPREFSGQARTPLEQIAFTERARRGAAHRCRRRTR